jgi:hypothetical protein
MLFLRSRARRTGATPQSNNPEASPRHVGSVPWSAFETVIASKSFTMQRFLKPALSSRPRSGRQSTRKTTNAIAEYRVGAEQTEKSRDRNIPGSHFSVPKFFCLQSFCQRPASVAMGHAAVRAPLCAGNPTPRVLDWFDGPEARFWAGCQPSPANTASKPARQRVFMKRPERGLQAASCVITAKSRQISWQPCNADAEAA